MLSDVFGAASAWRDWSRRALADAGRRGPLVIDHVVLAELHATWHAPAEVTARLAALGIETLALTDATAIRAGHAHRAYRTHDGPRAAILADFLIGAHAVTLGYPLLTRDKRRFASYFPELTIIAPEESAP